jgi:hypothetical protein
MAQQVHNINDGTTGTQHKWCIYVVYLLCHHLCCVPVVPSFMLCTCCAIIYVVYLLCHHLCCVPVVQWWHNRYTTQMMAQQVHNINDGTTGTQHKWWHNRYTTQMMAQQPVVLAFLLCTCCAIIYVVYLLCHHLFCVLVVPSFVLCTCCAIIYVVYLLCHHLCCVPVVLSCVLCTCCTIICVVYLLYYHVYCVTVVLQHTW